jgi:glutamate--cysteine ligase
VFPEVRLKRFIEMRGADSGPWGKICALPALWVGLLYDSTALNEAEALAAEWTSDEVSTLRDDVTLDALRATIKGRTVQSVARDVVEIAAGGLKRRAVAGNLDVDERSYLTYLRQIAESGRTAADDMLEAYETRWGKSVEPIFEEYAY